MNRRITMSLLCGIFAITVSMSGCGSQDETDSTLIVDIDGPPPMLDDADNDPHAHGESGPHGGHLIELGRNHKYHAEIVERGDDRSVAIYLLDTNMSALAIDDAEVLLNIVQDGAVSTFKFGPVHGAQGDRADYFICLAPELYEMLQKADDLTGKVNVKIDGVPYAGQLAHEAHDHTGHVH